MTKTNRVNDEKLLNEMFVTLEYSDGWDDFIQNLSDDCYNRLVRAIYDFEQGD